MSESLNIALYMYELAAAACWKKWQRPIAKWSAVSYNSPCPEDHREVLLLGPARIRISIDVAINGLGLRSKSLDCFGTSFLFNKCLT